MEDQSGAELEAAPGESPTRSVRISKPAMIGFCVLLCLGFFAYEVFVPHPASSEPKRVEILQGFGSRKIGALLKADGIINSQWIFVIYVSFFGEASLLKPGTYTFTNAAIPEIASVLVRGQSNERVFTIPEGWSLADIGGYFAEQGTMSLSTFRDSVSVSQAKKFTVEFRFLADKPPEADLEGYLFPDTYRVFLSARPEDVIGKMLENFGAKLTPELEKEIAGQKKTIFEIITVASIIEKEVSSDDDRAIVSGILWKRLSVGIPLQVDATISYIKRQATDGKRLGHPEDILLADTKIDSPYNTYRNRGLPPGPIANPSLSAIHAAIFPRSSSYLYYLSAPDGRTIFSRTLEEHKVAKMKYLSRQP